MDNFMQVVGIEFLDYVSKKTNKQVKGYNLHLNYFKDKCDGLAVCTEFVNEELGKDVKVLDKIQLFYNKFGKVSQINIL